MQGVLIYIKQLFYGLAFEFTGPIVHMVAQITWYSKTWLLLLMLAMVSFGSALMVLYEQVRFPLCVCVCVCVCFKVYQLSDPYLSPLSSLFIPSPSPPRLQIDPEPEANYSNFGMTMLTVWELVLGGHISLISLLTEGSWTVITLIIFSIFMLIVQLVLLNFLIALMWDIYKKVRK
jgi:hypothetical protein